MDPAVGWLAAFVAVVVLSLTSRINVGIVAVVAAWGVGGGLAGISADDVCGAFPARLFLTLLGVTLLFGAAEKNGSLAAVTQRIVAGCRGVPAVMPIAFFLVAAGLSAVGPGAIAATALVAPVAMATTGTAGVPVALMALMVANGANAGSLSPLSAVGVIVATQFEKAGIPVNVWQIFLPNFAAHCLVAALAYGLFGGGRLSWRQPMAPPAAATPLAARHWFTLAVLAAWIAAVVAGANLGLAAFTAVAILVLAGAADDKATLLSVPWAVLLMVCGVSLLVEIGTRTHGIDLFTRLLATVATPSTATGVMAFVTGLVSTYSSTSGVVYPAFLPAVPGLVSRMGGGDPLEIALSINVGAALVDVSPLSTLGALCLAAAPAGTDHRGLFRVLLLWGFAMTFISAILCWTFIGWFA
jgi:Na+/H+ antiporter NhaD/arsenite permease-like protein